ncbi:MAG: MFS transporter [Betaproteobacteria bacterium]|nr:MAG: MFS transporter [Betaproteobacteria bacterium]
MAVYLILFLALLNFTAFMGCRVLMSLFAIELGASTAAIGVLISLFALCPFLLSVYAGKVIDRFGSHLPAQLGTALSALGFSIPWLFPVLPALYLSALIIGLSFVFISLAIQNLSSTARDANVRARDVSLVSLGFALSGLFGPLLTGFVIDRQGHVFAYLLLTMLAIAATVGWLVSRRFVTDSHARGASAAPTDMRELLKLPQLRRTVVVSGLVVAGVDLYNFYMPIYGHSVGLSATMIGVVFGANSLAVLIVRGLLPRLTRWLGEERVMSYSMYLAGAAFLLIPVFEGAAPLMLLAFVLGLGLGCGQPLSILMTYNRAPAGRSGEALGVRFAVVNFTHMAIPLAFGTLGSALGVIAVFLSNAALMVGGGYANARGARAGT